CAPWGVVEPLLPVRERLQGLQVMRRQLAKKARRFLAIGHGMIWLASAEELHMDLSLRTDRTRMKWQNSPMAKPQPVPGYNVCHIIGQGGQAQVFLAEREHDGLRVALKVLNSAL